MNSKFNYSWLLIFFPLVFIIWYLNHKQENKPNHYLPYYGPKHAVKAEDTSYHTIPAFTFTNQFGRITNQNTTDGKIYVAEYFFTTCQTICPVMNNHMERVYNQFRGNKKFLILSHTVDPETDSVDVLKRYADEHGVRDSTWLFLTGNKPGLYSLARKGYLLDASEGKGDADDFVHTQNFALVDWQRHIRGYYDGTDSADVERMVKDINLLFEEYDYSAKSGH